MLFLFEKKISFSDSSENFDTICRDILFKKIQESGIRTNCLTFLQCHQTQNFETNGAKSQSSLITCGVPQGCILGPLLFLIYFDDFNLCFEHLKIVHSADDSTLYAKG